MYGAAQEEADPFEQGPTSPGSCKLIRAVPVPSLWPAPSLQTELQHGHPAASHEDPRTTEGVGPARCMRVDHALRQHAYQLAWQALLHQKIAQGLGQG
jgi:hypothetical protein